MKPEQTEDEAPSIWGAYARAWETFRAHPGRLLLLLVIFGVLQAPTHALDGGGARGLLAGLYRLFVVGPLAFGLSYAFLVAVRGGQPEVGDLFAPFARRYRAALGASVLLPLVIAISALPMVGAIALATLGDEPSPFLLLLAVGLAAFPIFAAARSGFVPYLLVAEGLGPVESLGESWERTRPVQVRIIGVELLSVPLLFLGLLLLIVGVLPAAILAGLALAAVYDEASPRPDESDENPAAPGPLSG